MWINIQLTQNAKKLTKTNYALKASKAQVLITTKIVFFMILIALDQAFFKTWKTYQHSKIHSGRQNNRNDNNTGHTCYLKENNVYVLALNFKIISKFDTFLGCWSETFHCLLTQKLLSKLNTCFLRGEEIFNIKLKRKFR